VPASAAAAHGPTIGDEVVIDLTGPQDAGIGPSAPPLPAPSPVARAGYFDSEPTSSTPTASGTLTWTTSSLAVDEDLSMLPDPPIGWEPDSVDVPTVFVLDDTASDEHDSTDSGSVLPPPQVVDQVTDAEVTDAEVTERRSGDDVWLLWAQDMFRTSLGDAGSPRKGQ
jgi:hypothetical protein